jgi:hypothetical protein
MSVGEYCHREQVKALCASEPKAAGPCAKCKATADSSQNRVEDTELRSQLDKRFPQTQMLLR